VHGHPPSTCRPRSSLKVLDSVSVLLLDCRGLSALGALLISLDPLRVLTLRALFSARVDADHGAALFALQKLGPIYT
jgi:hypothetical protein